MTKILYCRDAGFNCDAVVRAETVEEVLAQVRPHASEVHGVGVTPEMEATLRPLIADE